jgi:SAM-dependent methyltransferase
MGLIPEAIEQRRRQASAQFLAGSGIEIGALHSPLWVGPAVKVTYVDRMEVDDLRKHYPELSGHELTYVDIVDDGERLLTFPDRSLDFIIANHFLEHCENLLGAMRNHLRKLRPNGVLYYAVPDKRHTFDVDRPMTDFEHLIRDDQEGPAWSRRDHFLEWARLVDKASNQAAVNDRARHLMQMNYSIHFHVWDCDRFREILRGAWEYLGRTFSVEWLEENENEVVAVLRKCDPRPDIGPAWSSGSPAPPASSFLDRLKAFVDTFTRAWATDRPAQSSPLGVKGISLDDGDAHDT